MTADARQAALASLPPEFPAPWASDWGVDPYGLWMSLTVGGERQAFRWIPPGRFRMGSPPEEAGRGEDETPHQVELTQGFWLADTACTQALWEAVMGENPSRFKDEANRKQSARRLMSCLPKSPRSRKPRPPCGRTSTPLCGSARNWYTSLTW